MEKQMEETDKKNNVFIQGSFTRGLPVMKTYRQPVCEPVCEKQCELIKVVCE